IEAGEAVESPAIEVGEGAAEDYAAIDLNGERADGIVSACARIEASIEGAIGVEAGDAIAGDAIDGGEIAADDNFASVNAVGRIDGDSQDGAVKGERGVEGAINGAIVIEASQTEARQAADRGKAAARENATLITDKGLSESEDDVVSASAWVEG